MLRISEYFAPPDLDEPLAGYTQVDGAERVRTFDEFQWAFPFWSRPKLVPARWVGQRVANVLAGRSEPHRIVRRT